MVNYQLIVNAFRGDDIFLSMISKDVIARLKELTISEYSETKIDKDNLDPPLLFVFGKDINRKLVYVKLKIKESDNQGRCILCVSFHYAKDKMNFPYA